MMLNTNMLISVKDDQVSHKQSWDLNWDIFRIIWSDPIFGNSEQYKMAEMKERKQCFYEYKN